VLTIFLSYHRTNGLSDRIVAYNQAVIALSVFAVERRST